MNVMVRFNRDELGELCVGVMVESWDKRKQGVRNKREYSERFTAEQQRILDRYYPLFYKWELVTGLPEHATMKPETYLFLKDAVGYFSTV